MGVNILGSSVRRLWGSWEVDAKDMMSFGSFKNFGPDNLSLVFEQKHNNGYEEWKGTEELKKGGRWELGMLIFKNNKLCKS